MIDISWNVEAITKALTALAQRAENPQPALKAIGESLMESTKKRFDTSTTPDGQEWAQNTPATLAHKSGSKPLIDHGNLQNTITYQILDDSLAIGSPLEYAAMQQFGGKKSEFPNLFGDIPARPFLGISPSDATEILQTISDFLL